MPHDPELPPILQVLTAPLRAGLSLQSRGMDAALGFLESRGEAFREEVDRLREEFDIPRAPEFPGQGTLQDIASGIDPTGGAIVPEREDANWGLMLAAGLVGPDLGDVTKANSIIDDLAQGLPRFDAREIPTFVRRNFEMLKRAISGAGTENLNELDEILLEGMTQLPEQSEELAAINLLGARTQTELAERALRGDEVAQAGFREYIEPPTFSDDPFTNLLEIIRDDSPDYIFDRERVQELADLGRVDDAIFQTVLGIGTK